MIPDIIRHRVPTGVEYICNLGRCHPTSEIIVRYLFSDINFYAEGNWASAFQACNLGGGFVEFNPTP